MPQENMISRASLGLFAALSLILASIYMITYSGRIESRDTLSIMDATSSFVNFADLEHDESLYQEPPLYLSPQDPYPFLAYEPNEPLIVYVAAIPFFVARAIPGVGLVHATWLLNIILTVLSVGLFFCYIRLLNDDVYLAFFASLLLGLCTSIWPYSKTLFRAPLVMFFLLISTICLELWRRKYRHPGWLGLAIIAFIGAYYTKNSALVALPALLIIALPSIHLSRGLNRLLDGLLFSGLVLLIATVFIPIVFDFWVQIIHMIGPRLDTSFTRNALHSYLFSIGGSFWGTSPILLLGSVGAMMLIQEGKRRLVWAIVLLIVAYAIGHAFLTSIHWFGGLSWPPRFLIPIIPFAMLLVLPILQLLMQNKRWQYWLPVAILLLYSFYIQITATISWQENYVSLLPQEANGLVEWLNGLNEIRYLRWFLLPQSWNRLGFDIAWARISTPFIPTTFAVIALIAGFVIWRRIKRSNLALLALSLIFLLTTGIGLRLLYENDRQYWANKPQLFQMLDILQQNAENGEPLLLAGSSDVSYERFIMNYNRLNTIRPVVLGFQEGERASSQAEPTIVSDYNTDLFAWDIPRIIDHLANHHERIWWLAHNSIYLTWSIRPEERYLSENYYLLHEYTTDDPTVRLLEFSTVRAPNRYDFRLPEHLSNLQYGDSIRLQGFTLPSGTHYKAGDIVPITFYWQSDAVLEQDYVVAWFIVSEDGTSLIQGIDSMPDDNFSPTSTWQANHFVLDNRAIELPLDIPDGTYRIWVLMYPLGTDGTVRLPVTGDEVKEGEIAILPISLIITTEN
jgi:hypothetical protein